MTVLNILPECFVDTKVAKIITFASEKYNHQHGCGQIANQLKNRLRDAIALRIIDEDKNKGPVAKYYHLIFLPPFSNWYDKYKGPDDLCQSKYYYGCPETCRWPIEVKIF